MSEKNISPQSNIVRHDGKLWYQDPTSLVMTPVTLDEEPIMQESPSVYQPAEALPVKKERAKMRLGTKIWLGTGALSMVILPPAAHIAADNITNAVLNWAPGPDHTIPSDGLMKDLGHTIDQLLPGGDF